MPTRDFIIGALHQRAPQPLAEELPGAEAESAMTLEQVNASVAEIAVGLSLGGKVIYDVERLYQRLRDRVVAAGATPASSGLLIERVLESLPRGPAGDVAIRLVGSLRNQQLQAVGRAGLLALRAAACLVPPDESEAALSALDAELERRGPAAYREVGGTWLIAEGAHPEALDAAHARLDRMHEKPLLSSAIAGLAVVVVPQCERRTERALLLEHLRSFARREFDSSFNALLSQLNDHNITALEESRVMADAVAHKRWAKGAASARSLWRGLAARLRVGPDSMVAAD